MYCTVLYCTVLCCAVLYCTVGEKYHGTPLELGDARLGELAAWLQLHNITVVKLDCRTRVGFQVRVADLLSRMATV